jgi:predicted metal-dependent HD superfamily phosphohydrolase
MSGNTRIEAQATMLNQFLRTQRLFHREDMEKLYTPCSGNGRMCIVLL